MLVDGETTEFKFQKANGSIFSGTKILWNSLFQLDIWVFCVGITKK